MSMNYARMIFILLLFGSMAMAATITVVLSAPNNVKYGGEIQVNISVTNHLDHKVEAEIRTDVEPSETVYPPPEWPHSTPGMIAARPPFVHWTIELEAGETKMVYYIVHPKNVGAYVLSYVDVVVEGVEYTTDTDSINVMSSPVGKCDPSIGENHLTAPDKCPSGSADGFCDRVEDGRCDPDCTAKLDYDCQTPVPPLNGAVRAGPLSLALVPLCFGGAVILAIMAAVGYYVFIRKKKGAPAPDARQPDEEGAEEPSLRAEPAKKRKKLRRE